ncbi:MAG: NUDIX hydrolase [Bacilli bacterium]|nr:NUDIX hydrolase [Bacilli bacterium]
MKEIVINKTRLKEEELTEVLEKSRIVLRNDNDEIVMTRFGRVYFLPGGKIEPGEKPVDTIKREVMEETNINILLDDIEPFAVVYNYLRDYEIDDGSTVNRLVKTYYFTGFTTDENIEYFNLTREEKEDNLRGFFIEMEEAEELIADYNKDNPKASYLAIETKKILDEYKLLKEEE